MVPLLKGGSGVSRRPLATLAINTLMRSIIAASSGSLLGSGVLLRRTISLPADI
ncbi:MAG: hypothetical protein ACK4QP_07595 [Pseudorhizobium sp.]